MNLTQLLVTQRNVDEISAKFGLSQEQTLEAMAAVIPAFSEGLKRQATSPQTAAGLIKALSSGRHQLYMKNPLAAVSPEGIQDGNAILSHLFGNKEVSRAVANQASAFTGIGSSIFKSLLPVIASMVMGSLFKGATRGVRGNAGGGGLLGKIIEGLAGGMLGGGAAQPRRRQGGGQLPGSLEDLLGQVLGGGGRKQAPNTPMPRSRPQSQRTQRRQNPGGGLGGLIEEMLGGGRRPRLDPRAQMPRQRRPQQHQRPAPKRRGGGLGEIFGDMLEPGGNSSREYRRQTGSAFDEFLGN